MIVGKAIAVSLFVALVQGQSTSAPPASSASSTAASAATASTAAATVATVVTTDSQGQTVITVVPTSAAPSVSSFTSFLPVPSQATQSYDPNAVADQKQYLPSYLYNLTMESATTRDALCTQNMNFCSTAGCTDVAGTVTTNFCNNATMGWNCKCSKGDSRLQLWQVPINQYDCKFRNNACLTACQNPRATPAVKNVQLCSAACTNLYGVTCGTAYQVEPDYQVNNPSDTPKYFGDTTKGGTLPSSMAGSASPRTSMTMIGSQILAIAAFFVVFSLSSA